MLKRTNFHIVSVFKGAAVTTCRAILHSASVFIVKTFFNDTNSPRIFRHCNGDLKMSHYKKQVMNYGTLAHHKYRF